jgi:hypothetical protein
MTNAPFEELAFSTYHDVIVAELRASIRRYNDHWEDVLWKGWEQNEFCSPTVERFRLPVFVLSCTLLENVINFYLCTKCTAKQFKRIERDRRLGSLFGKWTIAPQEFVPSYSTSKDLALDLRALIDRRKAIIHAKPMISIDGDNRHTGNEPTIRVDEHEFVGRCATLPIRLIENILLHDEAFIALSHLRIRCGTIAHEFETGVYRQKTLFDYPRELIEELMQQGFERRKAIHCAILLGENPELDETGHYTIYPGRKIQIKPLKYFQKRDNPTSKTL